MSEKLPAKPLTREWYLSEAYEYCRGMLLYYETVGNEKMASIARERLVIIQKSMEFVSSIMGEDDELAK